MEVVKYTADMYPEIASWWDGKDGWASIDEALLPVTGFVVQDGNELICAGWVYVDGSTPICLMEWIVANTANSARTSMKGLNLLLGHMSSLAKENGKIFLTSLRQPRLVKLYEKHGFMASDTNMTNMVCS